MYIGNVNLEYGGMYITDLQEDYASVIEVTDLDSAAGAEGLTLIEHKTVILDMLDDKTRNSIEECCGPSNSIEQLIYNTVNYGYPVDPDCYNPPIIVVTEDYSGNKNSWNSWGPDRDETIILHRDFGGNLKAYVEAMF